MGRKNSRVQRSNDRGRIARKTAEDIIPRRPSQRFQIDPVDVIVPDGRCFFIAPRHGKVKFSTKQKAEKALAQAQKKRAASGSMHVEKRVYPCPPEGCGGWHLASSDAHDETSWKTRRRDIYPTEDR